MIEDRFNYKGYVQIYATTRDGKKVLLERHNNGTDRLFTFLCLALIGRSGAEYLPSYITLAKKDTSQESNNYVSVLSSTCKVFPSFTSTGPRAQFTGSIESYKVSDSTPASGNTKLYICLLDSRDDNTSLSIEDRLLAYVEVSDNLNDIPAGTVLNIEWSLGFENKAATTQSE